MGKMNSTITQKYSMALTAVITAMTAGLGIMFYFEKVVRPQTPNNQVARIESMIDKFEESLRLQADIKELQLQNERLNERLETALALRKAITPAEIADELQKRTFFLEQVVGPFNENMQKTRSEISGLVASSTKGEATIIKIGNILIETGMSSTPPINEGQKRTVEFIGNYANPPRVVATTIDDYGYPVVSGVTQLQFECRVIDKLVQSKYLPFPNTKFTYIAIGEAE